MTPRTLDTFFPQVRAPSPRGSTAPASSPREPQTGSFVLPEGAGTPSVVDPPMRMLPDEAWTEDFARAMDERDPLGPVARGLLLAAFGLGAVLLACTFSVAAGLGLAGVAMALI